MKPLREAFVICPISRPNSNIRQRSDALLERVIEPVLQSGRYGCTVGRADHFADDPDFTEIIHRRIARADLVVADLTDLNPNVLYELGHCHMLGTPVVLMIDSIDNLPSDIRNHKAIEYTLAHLQDEPSLNEIMAAFRFTVQGARGYTPRQQPPEVAQRIIERNGITTVEEVHNGRRDHYKVAQRLVSSGPKRICLLQRSSTMILGPEAQWGDEAGFYEAVWSAVADGSELFHVVTLDGIARHVQRPQSEFPDMAAALERLTRVGGAVGIPTGSPSGREIPIKLFPDETRDIDLKPDRQARALFADFGTHSEALVVMDFGGRQMSIRMKGREADNMFHTALDFYAGCETLQWRELRSSLASIGHEAAFPQDDEVGSLPTVD